MSVLLILQQPQQPQPVINPDNVKPGTWFTPRQVVEENTNENSPVRQE